MSHSCCTCYQQYWIISWQYFFSSYSSFFNTSSWLWFYFFSLSLSLSLSLNFSTNMHLSSLKSSALNLVLLVLFRLEKLKLVKRHLGRIWPRTLCSEDLKNWRLATNHYHAVIIKAKQTYYSSFFLSRSTESSSTFEKILIYFFNLHCSALPAPPFYGSLSFSSQALAKFFSDKIHKFYAIHKFYTSLFVNRISASPRFPSPFTPHNVSSFPRVTTDVSKLLSQ